MSTKLATENLQFSKVLPSRKNRSAGASFASGSKLAFHVEALDRDRKRPHENPSIGVLLCRTKDDEVVEYAMRRHLSPALVAQYQTQMIPKTVLQQKLHEWSQMLQAPESPDEDEL